MRDAPVFPSTRALPLADLIEARAGLCLQSGLAGALTSPQAKPSFSCTAIVKLSIQIVDKRSPRGFSHMFQKMSFSLALAAVCAVGATAQAQSTPAQSNASGTKVEMASYGQSYASGASGYAGVTMQTPQAMAYGQAWGGAASNRDSSRFYHYPYVFYPQNFQGEDFYKSSDSMYYRYRPEVQIPVYNRHWHNFYPSPRRYHMGHHFLTDVF